MKKLALILAISLASLPALSAQKYVSHAYHKWTTRHGVGSETSCDRGQLLEIKEMAARDALDACFEAGHTHCSSNGAVILINGDLVKKWAYDIIGEKWPPNLLSGYYYGCIARGSASSN